jgi:hypothetical protein
VFEVLASPSGSFTIILTQPNGLSCVMAAGENWENLPKRLAGAHIRPSQNRSAVEGAHRTFAETGDIR